MASLTVGDLAELRQAMARGQASVGWDKPTVNAALQAIENFFEGTVTGPMVGSTVKAVISGSIDLATAPFVFSGPQKKRLVAFWFRQKFTREGV